MPPTAKPEVGTIDKKGARAYWDAATSFGQPNATTTFSDAYDKEDFTYIDDDTYEGDRAKSLGYLAQVKLIKFLRTALGGKLTGVDFSKPGVGGAEREGRLRTVGSELFELLVRFTREKECQLGDVAAVAKERAMAPDKFVLYSGWCKALASKEFKRMRKKWRAMEDEAHSRSQSTPMVMARIPVVVGVELPQAAAPVPAPAPAPAPKGKDSAVVDIDSSSDEDEPPVPAPAPAGPSTVHVDSNGPETFSTVSMQTEHEESMHVRINTPEECRTQASDPNPDYDDSVALAMQLQEEEASLAAPPPDDDSVALAMQLQAEEDAAVPAEAVPKPRATKRRPGASAALQKEIKKLRKEGPRAAAPQPPPPPPPPTAIAATDDRATCFTDDEWRALGMEILSAYQAAKATYRTNRYDAENTPLLNVQTSRYHIETKRRTDGKSAGQQDTDVHFALHSPLHKITKKTKLRSVPDIKRAFGLA